MADEFGNKKMISAKTLEIAESIIKYTSGRKDVHCYYKYPFLKDDDTVEPLSMLIVSNSGIFNFYETKNDEKNFFIVVYPFVMKIDSLFEKWTKKIEIFKNLNVEDFDDLSIFDNQDILTNQEQSEFEELLQNSQSLNLIDSRETSSEKTLGYLIKKRSEQVNNFSARQFTYIQDDNISGFYRIRGLAGSGKTIVMIKKMATMHYRHPEYKMAFVFYSVSLKQTIINLFKKHYNDVSSGGSFNEENVLFLHAWGSSSNQGFYSLICDRKNIAREPYQLDLYTKNSFGSVCGRLLEKIGDNKLAYFDHVFIDEAQDFSINFFKLVKMSLTATGGLSYAYDELQTLSFSAGIPSKKEIFGEEKVIDVDLKNCYRTPKKILVTAHAFGMGIYRNNSENTLPVNIPQDKTIWQAVGYVSTPQNFNLGDNVVFSRDDLYSTSFVPDEPIIIKKFDDTNAQFAFLFAEIKTLIKSQDIKPEDILIIDLDSKYEDNFQEFRQFCFSRIRMGKNDFENKQFGLHLLGNDDRYNFKKPGSIAYTSVFRAKGNEANIVFVINSNDMLSLQSFMRNRLFTAMTRSMFKVYVFGCDGMEAFLNEYDCVVKNNYKLSFKYPSKPELERIQKIAKEEEDSAVTIRNVSESIGRLKTKDGNAYYEMLISLHGKEIADQIISLEKNETNPEKKR